MPINYSVAARALQDQHETRVLADRLSELAPPTISAEAQAMIEAADMFFLATADAEGRPQVSYKGGAPGFVKVLDETTLAFPLYDGNGQFLSQGNMVATGHIGLLFIDFERPYRRRINGTATVSDNDPLLAGYPEALAIVRVAVRESFGNCPRYIHKRTLVERSRFVPDAGRRTPRPRWKRLDRFADTLNVRERIAMAEAGETPVALDPDKPLRDQL